MQPQQLHNPNPTPKARFMASAENVARHKSLVDSEHFILACDAALIQAQSLWVQQISEPNAAMAVGFKIQGAMEFIQCLKLLAESPMPVKNTVHDNLIRS